MRMRLLLWKGKDAEEMRVGEKSRGWASHVVSIEWPGCVGVPAAGKGLKLQG
jgi:hypothetical protein